jgi:DNA-binding CsgD family transcriptional regulator
LWRESGDVPGVAETLHVLGHVRFDHRDYPAARELFKESLAEFQRVEDTIGALPLIGDLGLVAYHEGDFETADTILTESLLRYRGHGLKDRVAGTLNAVGDLALLAGDTGRATACYEESLELWRELRGVPGIASALHKLGQVSRRQQDNKLAGERFAEGLALQAELGNNQGIGECLAGLAATNAASGRPVRAAQLFAASSALLASIGVPLAPVDQMALDRDIDANRRQLGIDAWDKAWSAGSALMPEQAIRLALVDEADGSPIHGAGDREPEPEAGLSRLSRRERQVTQLLAQGLTYREISSALFISERTVGSHVGHIMTKLGIRSRTRVAVWAVEHGLGGSPPA